MRYLAFSALIILLLPTVSLASNLTVFAPEMKVARKGGLVELSFPSGLRAVSPEYNARAGKGVILLRSEGSAGLADEKQPGESGLPKLPATSFSVHNIKQITFSQAVTWESKEHLAKASRLSSSDGGKTWQLAGGVEFSRKDSRQSARGKEFTFSNSANTLMTTSPIEFFGFAVGGERASFSSKRTVINLKSQTAELAGVAKFSFAGYMLTSERMSIDLKAQKLNAEGSPKLISGDSAIEAKKVTIAFVEGKAVLDAIDLKGRLAAPKGLQP